MIWFMWGVAAGICLAVLCAHLIMWRDRSRKKRSGGSIRAIYRCKAILEKHDRASAANRRDFVHKTRG